MPIGTETLIAFAAVCLGLALTLGPNMIYLVSRSLTQGWRAGVVSLAGVVAALAIYVSFAVLGLTAIALAVPFLYAAINYLGAAYLLWLAWQAVKPGGASPFHPKALPRASSQRLLAMGFLTALLNPKIALLYIALLTQFVDPAAGALLVQHLTLGVIQIAVSASVNLAFVLTAGAVAAFLQRRPIWLAVQRYIMGVVLGALAVRLALERR